MNKGTKARKYHSSKLQELLDEVTPLEMEQAKVKMQLAARIEDFMKAKGWTKSQFAEKAGKNPSEITKWLSGTQNFTVDILTEIATCFNVEVTSLLNKQRVQVIDRKEIVVKAVAGPTVLVTTPYESGIDLFEGHYYATPGAELLFSKSYHA